MFKKKASATPRAMPDIHDLYAPDRISEYDDYLMIEDTYGRLLVVDALPENLHFGWFNNITVIGGVTVSVLGVPYTYKEASDRVAERMAELGAELITEEKRDNRRRILTLQEKYSSYELFLKEVNMHRNNLVAVTVVILVSAPSYRELIEKCQLVKNGLGATRAVTLYKKQLIGLENVLPFVRSSLPEYHDVTVGNFACLSPLISTDFTHPNGIYFGTNDTGSPVLLNLFLGSPWLNGLHMFLTGMTRSGKSVTCKGIVSRSIAQLGVSFVILDPEGEYEKLCAQLNGLHIRIHSSMPVMFNPFDLEAEYDKNLGWFVNIPEKQDDIVQLLATITESQGERITAEERGVAGLAVAQEYASRGITPDPESLYVPGGIKTDEGYIAGKSYKEMPTISSYAARLKSLGADRLANILLPFCRGGPQGFFDGQSQADISKYNLVCFDLSRLNNEFSRIYGMYVMLSWVWEKFVKKDKAKRKSVLVDESWLFMKHRDTAEFLSQMARRGSKYNTSLMAASQSFREFTTQEGMVFMGQCDTKFFLKMQHTDLLALGQMFNLPKEVIERMDSFSQGQGLLQAGNESAVVRFKMLPFEEEFLRSDPEAVLLR